jgi:glycosidase
MEVGDTTESGAPALFEKLPIFWAIAERRPEFGSFYKQVMTLRRDSTALRRGTMKWVPNSDEARVVTFMRSSPDEDLLVAINFSNRPFTGTVRIDRSGGFTEVGPSIARPLTPDAPAAAKTAQRQSVFLPALSLDAWGYRIFRKPK